MFSFLHFYQTGKACECTVICSFNNGDFHRFLIQVFSFFRCSISYNKFLENFVRIVCYLDLQVLMLRNNEPFLSCSPFSDMETHEHEIHLTHQHMGIHIFSKFLALYYSIFVTRWHEYVLIR